MRLSEYQEKAWNTAIFPNKGKSLDYPLLGLCGELGEVAEKVKKIIRDDNSVITDQKKVELIKEFGDVFWYIAAIATTCHISLGEQFGDVRSNSEMLSLPWLIFCVKELQKQKGLLVTVVETLHYEKQLDKVDKMNTELWKHSIAIISLIGVLGTILKYIDLCLDCIEVTREEVLETNITKLLSRKERGKLTGSGDNR